MGNRLLDRILPRGPELLRRLALAEVLGPPPIATRRREAQLEARRAEAQAAALETDPEPKREP